MKKHLVFIALALAASLCAFALYRSGFPFIEQVDLRLKDARFRLRGALQPGPETVVVAIDNRSVKEVGRWPWSREVSARLIEAIAAQGARVIALDMVFSEPQGEDQDRALGKAVADAGNVVMGYFFRNELQTVENRALEQVASSKVKLLRLDPGVTSIPVTEFPSLDANIASVAQGASDFGFFNQIPDPDGLFRKAPLLLLYDGDLYPSLGLAGLGRYLGGDAMVDVAGFGVRSVAVGGTTLPVNEAGELALNYYGPAGSFATFSAADLLKGTVPAGALKGKLVFVGVTETGVYDLRATPFDATLPGVEIHATVAANALERSFLLRDGRTLALEMGSLFLLPLLLALLLGSASRTWMGLGYFALSALGYFALNYLSFKHLTLDLSPLFPTVPLLFTYLGCEAYRNLVLEKRGRYLKRAFASYVSPELVTEILRDPDRLRLGGEKREVTVLFSDIRGFTTLSESLAPEELVRLLNDYLNPMTRIILDEKGTLDKYLGDAMMALFNAPLDLEGHAGRACRSALRMVAALDELNRDFSRRGLPQVDIGIGINSGEAVVGNMGADMRFDYTAIGDNVNLASRLEGLNKLYGTRVLVSEMTRSQVREPFVFREVDLVRVKGKQQPVAVFELMTGNEELAPRFVQALQLYRERRFGCAGEIFAELSGTAQDGVSSLYLERCREFQEHPPPMDWDGVFTAKSK